MVVADISKFKLVPPSVSVIIAAYNAEDFLERAIDSVLSQSFKNLELIVVNDGSGDATGRIADQYAVRDNRVNVVHAENRGVASARQRGLECASGEYILYFDADDWAEGNMVEEMYVRAKEDEADLLFCDFFITHDGTNWEYVSQNPGTSDRSSIFGLFMYDMYGTLWNTMFRRDAILKYKISFIEGMKACEDQYFNLQLLSHDIRVAYLPKAYYHYDMSQNPSSIVNKGITIKEKLRPLVMIAEYTDISHVRQFYCDALFRRAWEALWVLPDYAKVIYPHRHYIMQSSAPLRSKMIIWLKIKGMDSLVAYLFKIRHRRQKSL